jgi:hypothetical protein
MSLLSGIFNTGKNPAELNARSFAGTILRLFPNGSAPMFALSSQSGKSSAKATTHGYFSKVMTFINTTITTAVADGVATNFEVASTTGMTVGMVLYVPSTRENVRVTAIVDGTNITVKRGFGRVAAAAIADNAVIFQIGTAFEEGSTRPTARQLATTYIPNYTQIFRNAWGLTDTARASLAEMGYSNVAESRKDCAMFHSVDIESAILWGQPVAPAVGPGGQPLHATQGVIDAMEQYAPANTNAAGSTTTYDQLVTLFEPAFQYSTDMANPKERVLFGDAQAIRVINAIGVKSGQVQITQNETSFGMHFTKFKFYKGTVNLIEHPLLNGLGQQGTAVIMDMPALKLAYMDGRDTKAEEYGAGGKIVESGTDGVGGSLTTELAVELINPYSCAVVTNLTAAA